MTDCPECGGELERLDEDYQKCKECAEDFVYFDYHSDGSTCPECGMDLSTDLIENDRIIVKHPCPRLEPPEDEEVAMVEVSIRNDAAET